MHPTSISRIAQVATGLALALTASAITLSGALFAVVS